MTIKSVHPKALQERLGHATINTTLDTYSHVFPGLQKGAVRGFGNILNKEFTR
jgi:integrase